MPFPKHNWAWGYLPVSVQTPQLYRKVLSGWRPIEAISTPVPMGEVTEGECILVDTPNGQIEITGHDGTALVRVLPPGTYHIL